jgi:hypothetical protein
MDASGGRGLIESDEGRVLFLCLQGIESALQQQLRVVHRVAYAEEVARRRRQPWS